MEEIGIIQFKYILKSRKMKVLKEDLLHTDVRILSEEISSKMRKQYIRFTSTFD